jgi:hypothetical protein
MFDSEIFRWLPQVPVRVMVACRLVYKHLARNQMRFGGYCVSQLAAWKLKKKRKKRKRRRWRRGEGRVHINL